MKTVTVTKTAMVTLVKAKAELMGTMMSCLIVRVKV
jgi:hypothetical protein